MNEYISLASSEGLPLDPVSSFSTDQAQPSVQQTPGVILLTSSLVSIFRTLTAFFSFFLFSFCSRASPSHLFPNILVVLTLSLSEHVKHFLLKLSEENYFTFAFGFYFKMMCCIQKYHKWVMSEVGT